MGKDEPVIGGNPVISPNPSDPGYVDSPTPTNPRDGKDYDAIRRLIKEFERKIAELEKQLPENQ